MLLTQIDVRVDIDGRLGTSSKGWFLKMHLGMSTDTAWLLFDESAVTGRMSEIEANSDEVDCYWKEVSFFKARTLGTLPTKVTFRLPLILQIIN